VTKTKPAEVRFYVDADILGLAKTLAALRTDVTHPGDVGTTIKRRERAACPITSTATPDLVWLPEVASRGWLILTRDRNIQRHTREIAMVRDSGARMVALSTDEAKDTWHQLEVVMCQWRAIEACLDQEGPFIYTATRTGLRSVKL
jgi:hypothetical protein